MKTVLVIDDDKLILSLLANGLRAFTREYNILTAENGKEAVRILASMPVDIVVTDLNMPEMDGYELLTCVRENWPATMVVAMTADYSPEVRSRLSRLGVSKCFEKPFRFEDLAAWVMGIPTMNLSCRISQMPLLD